MNFTFLGFYQKLALPQHVLHCNLILSFLLLSTSIFLTIVNIFIFKFIFLFIYIKFSMNLDSYICKYNFIKKESKNEDKLIIFNSFKRLFTVMVEIIKGIINTTFFSIEKYRVLNS